MSGCQFAPQVLVGFWVWAASMILLTAVGLFKQRLSNRLAHVLLHQGH